MNSVSDFEILFDRQTMASGTIPTDCACPAIQPVPQSSDLAPETRLQHQPALRSITLTPTHRVAFVPSLSWITVVNQAAWALLERLQTPYTLADLNEDEQVAAQQLYALGLLHANDDAPHSPPAHELVAWLHVTNACNLRCTYCYIDKTAEAMTTTIGITAIDTILRSAQQYGYRSVQLKYAGGEASLNLPLVAEMHRYAQAQAHAAGIALRGVLLSNGVGLSHAPLQTVRDLGVLLMISLDGPPQFHDAQRPRSGGQGSFHAVVASIEGAQALDMPLTVSVTVTGASVAGLPTLVAWLLERDIHFALNFYRPTPASADRSELQLDEQRLIAGMRAAYEVIEGHLPRYSLLGCLLDRTHLGAPHHHVCGVGEHYMVIDHHGHVAKCQMEIGHAVGTIWDADPLQLIRNDRIGVQNVPVEAKADCHTCVWQHWCAGGCPVATWRATGRFDLKSPNCAIYQALYPEVIRLEGLRLLQWADRS